MTDQEVQQFFEENQEIFATDGEIPPLEEVEGQIRQRLQAQRLAERFDEVREAQGVQILEENLTPLTELEFGE